MSKAVTNKKNTKKVQSSSKRPKQNTEQFNNLLIALNTDNLLSLNFKDTTIRQVLDQLDDLNYGVAFSDKTGNIMVSIAIKYDNVVYTLGFKNNTLHHILITTNDLGILCGKSKLHTNERLIDIADRLAFTLMCTETHLDEDVFTIDDLLEVEGLQEKTVQTQICNYVEELTYNSILRTFIYFIGTSNTDEFANVFEHGVIFEHNVELNTDEGVYLEVVGKTGDIRAKVTKEILITVLENRIQGKSE